MLKEILIDGLSLGIIAGIIATVYINVLPYERPFYFWWRFGGRFEKKWFFPAVWGCHKCFAGQFCLWFYLWLHTTIEKTYGMPAFCGLPCLKMNFAGYCAAGHIFSICAGILSAIIFTKILNLTK